MRVARGPCHPLQVEAEKLAKMTVVKLLSKMLGKLADQCDDMLVKYTFCCNL